MSATEYIPEKVRLGIVSYGIGFVIFLKVAFHSKPVDPVDFLLGVVLLVLVPILYMEIGRGTIGWCRKLRLQVCEGQVEDWDLGKRIRLSAYWPIVFPCCVVWYVSLDMINDIFHSEEE